MRNKIKRLILLVSVMTLFDGGRGENIMATNDEILGPNGNQSNIQMHGFGDDFEKDDSPGEDPTHKSLRNRIKQAREILRDSSTTKTSPNLHYGIVAEVRRWNLFEVTLSFH